MVQSWQKPVNPKWMDTNIHVNDPVQGCAADCALIAALSSLAWVQKGLISSAIDPTTIPFYSEAGSQSQNSTVDWNLCYEGSTLVYAHSSTPNEIWPAIYEKAYGSWRLGSQFISCSNYDDVNWGGNPGTALTHLTNKACTTKLNAGKNPATIISDIKLKCTILGKTKYPMVAWTYPTAPNGLSYDAQISASHSYSLLGLYPTYTGNEIVLRNPVGVSTATKSAGTMWNAIDLGLGDGIFTVASSDFQQKFEAYGYVVF